MHKKKKDDGKPRKCKKFHSRKNSKNYLSISVQVVEGVIAMTIVIHDGCDSMQNLNKFD